jgi:dTDP-4-dehydrorhamnose reductase
VSDQVGVPTSAHLLADVSMMLVNRLHTVDRKDFPFGIYHVAPSGNTNWCDFARFVIGEAIKLGDTFNVAPNMILPIKTKDYPTTAKRPMNSRLATSLFERAFSIKLPPWEEGVFAIMKSIYRG